VGKIGVLVILSLTFWHSYYIFNRKFYQHNSQYLKTIGLMISSPDTSYPSGNLIKQ